MQCAYLAECNVYTWPIHKIQNITNLLVSYQVNLDIPKTNLMLCIYSKVRIRNQIRIEKLDPDPDPH